MAKPKPEGELITQSTERLTISVTLDPDTYFKVEAAAKEDDRSKAMWLARYLRKQLNPVA